MLYPDKPDVIYSALLGGLMVLVTTMLTNRQARKRQERDLLHQSEQKDKERIHSLKRDIYIPLVEAHSIATTFLAKMPIAPAEQLKSQEPLQALGHIVSKLALIAPPEVLEPVHICAREVIKCATRLGAERWQIDDVSGELSLIESDIQWHIEYQKNQSAEMKKMEDEGHTDVGKMEKLKGLESWSQTKLKEGIDQKLVLIEKKAMLELALLQKSAVWLRELGGLSTNAIIAIRSELGLPIDPAWMLSFQEANTDAGYAIVEEFRSQTEKRVSAREESVV